MDKMDKTLNDNSILELLKSIQSELSGLHEKVSKVDMSADDRLIINAYIGSVMTRATVVELKLMGLHNVNP